MKMMKTLMIGAVLAGASILPAMAQTVVEPTTTEWSTWDAWGNKHTTTYTELKAHPDWAYNDGYIHKHPELKAYYDEHPGYWGYVHSHHDWYKNHPGGWSKTTTTTTVEH